MEPLSNYQLFLFDFDGLLVNTEELHYKAYQKMCSMRGFSLDWSWREYVQNAQFRSTGLKEGIYRQFPDLLQQEPSWDILYQEKKRCYYQILQEGTSLMPGVHDLLTFLAREGKKRCVVTHSPAEQIALIRKQHPVLDTIPVWITREDYKQPKPSPECYLKAIEQLAADKDKIIGFEDSPRGLKALLDAGVEGVLVTTLFEKGTIEGFDKPFTHLPSLLRIMDVA